MFWFGGGDPTDPTDQTDRTDLRDRQAAKRPRITNTAPPASHAHTGTYHPFRPPGSGTRSPSPRTTRPAQAAAGAPSLIMSFWAAWRAAATLGPFPRWR